MDNIRFPEHKYAQTYMRVCEDRIYLISYYTAVACFWYNGDIACSGTYSQTTRKHIGAFMREYVEWPNGERGDYYTAKHCFEGNYRLNIHTGEVEEL